jgi:hypothetical protein
VRIVFHDAETKQRDLHARGSAPGAAAESLTGGADHGDNAEEEQQIVKPKTRSGSCFMISSSCEPGRSSGTQRRHAMLAAA